MLQLDTAWYDTAWYSLIQLDTLPKYKFSSIVISIYILRKECWFFFRTASNIAEDESEIDNSGEENDESTQTIK